LEASGNRCPISWILGGDERRSEQDVRRYRKHEYVSNPPGYGLDDMEEGQRVSVANAVESFQQLNTTRGVESFSGEAV
jgi:hypothetical protein